MNYQMHIAGPDDVIEYGSEIEALREANVINKLYLEKRDQYGDDAPLMVATVAASTATIAEQEFSKNFPIGTAVKYFPIAGQSSFEEAYISSEPFTLGCGEIVVKLQGKRGGFSIKHIEKI